MHFSSFKSKVILIALFCSASLTILSAVSIVYIIPGVIENEIFKSVKLIQGTEQYDRFMELPFPVTLKVHFFNVENPTDILNGRKPVVKELGPYVYKEYRRKTINDTNDNDDTISFIETETFLFDEEASGDLLDTDFVTTLNAALFGILETAEKIGQTRVLSKCLKDIFNDMNSVFIKVRVRDILFQGLRFCVRHFSLCEFQRTVVCNLAATKRNVDKLEDGSLQFSFLGYKNNKGDDLFTIKRGIKDELSLGQIVKLNNSTYTHFWERNSTCDQVNGTYFSLFPPQIQKQDSFQVYSTDICRSVELKFFKEDFYKDIKGYMFSTDKLALRKKEESEENCFCVQQTQGIDGENTCFLDGVIDMQPCTGSPVLLSFPHFLWADKLYTQSIEGVYPNEESHKTFLLIEPVFIIDSYIILPTENKMYLWIDENFYVHGLLENTGTPLQAISRIQVNAVLRPISHIKETENLPRLVLPLLWIEENVSLPDEYVAKLRETYFDAVQVIDTIKWVFLAVSLLFTMIFGVYVTWRIFM